MEAFSVNESLTIRSSQGPYEVKFEGLFSGLDRKLLDTEHLIIDERVASLYAGPLKAALQSRSVIRVEAIEESKSLEKIPDYVVRLTENGCKRGHTVIAVGGGIVQDIVSFLGTILFRGIDWKFYPTTCLAQADSCIGSKSSI